MGFTKEELFRLKTRIRCETVIEKVLGLETKRDENRIYRFSCPACKGFDTRINQSNNLSYCFNCNRRFNTIDLVMAGQQVGFVEAVQKLQALLKASRKPRTQIADRNPAAKSDSLESIGDILRRAKL